VQENTAPEPPEISPAEDIAYEVAEKVAPYPAPPASQTVTVGGVVAYPEPPLAAAAVTSPVTRAIAVAAVVGCWVAGMLRLAALMLEVVPGVAVAGISFATNWVPCPSVVKTIGLVPEFASERLVWRVIVSESIL